jgi:hypothetical protein
VVASVMSHASLRFGTPLVDALCAQMLTSYSCVISNNTLVNGNTNRNQDDKMRQQV